MYRSSPSRSGFTLALGVAVFCLAGCYQKMSNQPKYQPLEASPFFDDGRASRPPIPGTVARGHANVDEAFYTGRLGGELLRKLPIHVDRQLLLRGRERYNIYCTPCHDQVGNGQGMVVQRGFPRPPSFHEKRLREEVPVGHFFEVITMGFGKMASYAGQVPVRDRWAIVSYIRALQLSQHATLQDLPAVELQKLQEASP